MIILSILFFVLSEETDLVRSPRDPGSKGALLLQRLSVKTPSGQKYAQAEYEGQRHDRVSRFCDLAVFRSQVVVFPKEFDHVPASKRRFRKDYYTGIQRWQTDIQVRRTAKRFGNEKIPHRLSNG